MPLSKNGYENFVAVSRAGLKVKLLEKIGKSMIVNPYASISWPSNWLAPFPLPKPPIKLNFPSSTQGTGILLTIAPTVIKLPIPGLSSGPATI